VQLGSGSECGHM